MSDLAPSAASGSLLTGHRQPVSPSQTVNGAGAAAVGALHSPQAETTVPSQAVTKLSPMDPAQALDRHWFSVLVGDGFFIPSSSMSPIKKPKLR